MTSPRNWNLWVGVFCLLGCGLAGCSRSPAARFYLLTRLDAAEATGMHKGEQSASVSIGLGPVELPEYLDRSQIVTRGTRHRLMFAEYDRWAEPLESRVTDVLRSNLAILLSNENITILPSRVPSPMDYRVPVRIDRFDGGHDGVVTLVARWAILDSAGEEIVPIRRTRYEADAGDGTVELLVAAMSAALESFSRDVAEALDLAVTTNHGLAAPDRATRLIGR